MGVDQLPAGGDAGCERPHDGRGHLERDEPHGEGHAVAGGARVRARACRCFALQCRGRVLAVYARGATAAATMRMTSLLRARRRRAALGAVDGLRCERGRPGALVHERDARRVGRDRNPALRDVPAKAAAPGPSVPVRAPRARSSPRIDHRLGRTVSLICDTRSSSSSIPSACSVRDRGPDASNTCCFTLHPRRAAGEWFQVYTALPELRESRAFSVSLPNDYNLAFSHCAFATFVLVINPIGACIRHRRPPFAKLDRRTSATSWLLSLQVHARPACQGPGPAAGEARLVD